MAFMNAAAKKGSTRSTSGTARSTATSTRTARASAASNPAPAPTPTPASISALAARNRSRGEGKSLIWTHDQDLALTSAVLAGNTDPEELLAILREDDAFDGAAGGLLTEQKVRLRMGELRRYYEGLPSLDKRASKRYNPSMNKELANLLKPKRV